MPNRRRRFKPKGIKETKETLCVYCGRPATRINTSKQPVCVEHRYNPPKKINCPNCGFPMRIQVGKYGYFWGCINFPACDKTLSLKGSLNLEKFAD